MLHLGVGGVPGPSVSSWASKPGPVALSKSWSWTPEAGGMRPDEEDVKQRTRDFCGEWDWYLFEGLRKVWILILGSKMFEEYSVWCVGFGHSLSKSP